MLKLVLSFHFFLLGFSVVTCSQTEALKKTIEQIIKQKKVEAGVAVSGLETIDTLSINGKNHFPMQSVYKFHLAIAVMQKVDEGKLSLDQKVWIKKSEMLPIGGALYEKYPNGEVELTIGELLSYSVSKSDNNSTDILFNLIGGTAEVNNCIHRMGITDINILSTENEMYQNQNLQFSNWTTPLAANQLLTMLYFKEILSEKSRLFLWKILFETTTGMKRIKGNLPKGTSVAHKTGTSATENGITSAINDIGVVVLPNGKYYAISVFVTNSKENYITNEQLVADISRAVWDYFVLKYK